MTMYSRLRLIPLAILVVALGLASCEKKEKDTAVVPKESAASEPSSAPRADERFDLIAVNVDSDDANVKRKFLDLFHENVKKQFSNGLPGNEPDDGARCANCDKTPPEEELRYEVLDKATVHEKFKAAMSETQQAAGSVLLLMSSTRIPDGGGPDCNSALCPTPTPCTCIKYLPSPSGCRVKGVGPPYMWCTKP